MTRFGHERAGAPLSVEIQAHAAAFRARFGPDGALRLFFAPGRVNLMGAHLDYNGGPVMPTAIDRGTFIALRPRADRRLRLASSSEERVLELALSDLPSERSGLWADYPLGVAIELLRARHGNESITGIDLFFGGNLPVGAGLSSSASICVGTAFALNAAWSLGLGRMDEVRAALAAERGFVGVQCGIMDPYAVGLARPGHVLWLDCKDATSAHLPFDFEHLRLAVIDSGVRRELAEGAFNLRVAECRAAFERLAPHEPGARCLRDVRYATFEAHRAELAPSESRRAEHVLREVSRTFAARDALAEGRPESMGRLMSEAHASLRDLFEVSCPELDAILEAASGVEGVLGGRLTGAGFGGCAVVLLESGAEEALERRVVERFSRRFGRAPRVDFFAGDHGPRELELGSD